VRANYVFAKSVIHNILDNAVKYHSKERQLSIKISCETLEEFVCVTITDNGIGIDLKLHKNRIFGMFNRFNNTTEGTGMGLFIVKKMIEQMEGNIVIESELDIGTSFKIYFKRGI
jgi:signal transduction histidine kinase